MRLERHTPWPRAVWCRALLSLALLAGAAHAAAESTDLALGSKTPYAAPSARLQPAPAGFQPVAVLLVARHGSRGLTKPGPDDAALALWHEAEAAGALTPAGRQFGADLQALMAAQRRLGYGQLSALGQREHRELARRLVARLPALFAAGPRVELRSSGVERAVDSAAGFAASLREQAPQARLPDAVQVDRFLLYFHRLSISRDGAAAITPEQQATLQRSLDYQHWLKSPVLARRLQRVDADPRLPPTAQALLRRLYAPAFVDGLARRGEALAAAQALVDLRGAAADLALELGAERTQHLLKLVPLAQARVFAERDDAEDFYRKGPGVLEDGTASYGMAQPLLDDLLARLPEGEGVALRFAHAEIVAPLVSLIGVAGVHQPQPEGQPYGYAVNPWRSAAVIPMAANVQWEVWRDADGQRWARLLLNEGEVDLKPACDGARRQPGSHFYRVAGVLACYRSR